MADPRPVQDDRRPDSASSVYFLSLHHSLSILESTLAPIQRHLVEVRPDYALQSIQQVLQAIETPRQIILENIHVFGDAIATRWMEWPVEKRREVLSTAWARVATLQAHITSPIVDQQLARLNKATHCGPDWLHDEALYCDASTFLRLLDVRAKNPPSRWAAFDCRQQIDDDDDQNPLPLLWSDLYLHLCGSNYGQKAEDDAKLAGTWTIAAYRYGLSTAHNQYKIMQTLRFVSKAIVADSKPSSYREWTALAANGFQDHDVVTPAGSYFDQCTSSPPVLDLAELAATIDRQVQRLLDEIKMMQTDPSYMQHYVSRLKADAAIDEGQVPAEQQSMIIARMFLSDWSENLLIWRRLQLATSQVLRLVGKSGLCVKPGQGVSAHVHWAITYLLQVAELCLSMQRTRVAQQLPFTRAFHEYFSYSIESQGPVLLKSKYNDAKTKERSAVDWQVTFIHALAKHEVTQDCNVIERAFRRFETAMTSKDHNADIDERLCCLLADLTITDQLATSVRYCQIGPPIALESGTDTVSFPFHRDIKVSVPARLASDESTKRIGLQLQTLARVPWPSGPKDMAWCEKTVPIRQNLRELWDEVRIDLDRASTILIQKQLIVKLDIKYDTQPSHVAVVERGRAQCYVISYTPPEASGNVSVPRVNDTLLDQASSTSREITNSQAQLKSQSFVGSKPNVPPPKLPQRYPTAKPDYPSRISVNKGSFTVLQGIFRTVNYQGKKSLEWSLLVKTMRKAGCKVEPQRGSAWSFEYGKSMISLHRPHPKSYYEHQEVRKVAYRLFWNFGWTAASFVLEEKNED
nr:hypothetical protein B0A51_15144 [Rachicladosporium sp. CCFEE 5018]